MKCGAINVRGEVMDSCGGPSRWTSVTLLIALACLSGCSLSRPRINAHAVEAAREALAQNERDLYYGEADDDWDDDDDEEEKPGIGTVIIAEALAIFPGVLVHGMGHWYAGDKRTFRRLSRMGQVGYVLTAVGGGLVVGGYALDKDDSEALGQSLTDPVAYTLYGTGGVAGGIGVLYLLSAWVYDMIDTPRAVLSGGRPPARSPFVDALDIFE